VRRLWATRMSKMLATSVRGKPLFCARTLAIRQTSESRLGACRACEPSCALKTRSVDPSGVDREASPARVFEVPSEVVTASSLRTKVLGKKPLIKEAQ